MSAFHVAYALLPGAGGTAAQVGADVLIEVAGGRFTAVTPGVRPPAGAVRLAGLAVPGLANAHSHAFHRALRGRTHDERGTFWSWREAMYALAARLDPDSYHALARATYAEMACAGITAVGEFHYLHHPRGGGRYGDPNAMGTALIEAARDAGIRITLLDTLYLTGAPGGGTLAPVQQRFCDGTAEAWAQRVDALRAAAAPGVRIGVAAHSVRAVPPAGLPTVVAAAGDGPLHVHLSEQRAENAACLAAFGASPAQVLGDAGVLGPATTAVHATHIGDDDRTLLGDTETVVCLCPTTERDLADGIGPARALADAGSPICLGSDSHAVIDLFEEARALEMHERLRSERRGHFSAAELAAAATAAGQRALGWADAGVIAPGARADLVTIRLDSPRTAGADPMAVPAFAATAADVVDVMVDGRIVVADRHHAGIDTGPALAAAITAVLP